MGNEDANASVAVDPEPTPADEASMQQTQEESQAEKKEPIEVGASVFALDRGNIGVVQGYNAEAGEYTVTFRNEQGHTATRNLPANIVTEISTQQTAPAKAIEEQLTLQLRNSQQVFEKSIEPCSS